MANISRITTVSFLTYFIFPQCWHLSELSLDRWLNISTKQYPMLLGSSVGWTGGNFVGAVIALVIFDYLGLKKLFTVIYGLIAASLIALRAIDNLDTASYLLGLVGLGSGIGLAGAAITISRSYTEARRASMLVITDGCFSVAGFLVSWAATFSLVTQALGWELDLSTSKPVRRSDFLTCLSFKFSCRGTRPNLQETEVHGHYLYGCASSHFSSIPSGSIPCCSGYRTTLLPNLEQQRLKLVD